MGTRKDQRPAGGESYDITVGNGTPQSSSEAPQTAWWHQRPNKQKRTPVIQPSEASRADARESMPTTEEGAPEASAAITDDDSAEEVRIDTVPASSWTCVQLYTPPPGPRRAVRVLVSLAALVAAAASVMISQVPPLMAVVVIMVVLVVLAWATVHGALLDRVLPAKHVIAEPVPSAGVRGFFWKFMGYQLYSRFGWEWPAEIGAKAWRKRYAVANDFIWSVKDLVDLIVAVVNPKGGSGKSPLATNGAAEIADSTELPVVVIDVNENDGTTADDSGVKYDETIRLREFISRRDEFRTFQALSKVARSIRHLPYLVIGSDHGCNDPIDTEEFRDAVHIAKADCLVLVIDEGNGTNNVTNLVSNQEASVLWFPARVQSNKALRGVQGAMKQLRARSLEGKVKSGIIVIIGDKLSSRARYAAELEWPLERVFVIPTDKYMMSGAPVNPRQNSFKVRTVFKELWAETYRVELQKLEAGALPRRQSAADKDVDDGAHAGGSEPMSDHRDEPTDANRVGPEDVPTPNPPTTPAMAGHP